MNAVAKPEPRKKAKADRKRITDAGEKIGGARKHEKNGGGASFRSGATLKQSDVYEKKALWPRPDFAAAARSGWMTPQRAVLFVVWYEALGVRPITNIARGATHEMHELAYKIIVETVRRAFEDGIVETLNGLQEEIKNALASCPSTREVPMLIYAAGRRVGNRVNHPLHLRADAIVRRNNLVSLGWPHDERVQDTDAFGAENFSKGQSNAITFWRAVRGDKNYYYHLGPELETREEALEQAKQHWQAFHAARAAKQAEPKKKRFTVPKRPDLGRPAERIGKDWRNGQPATTDDFLKHFRFRGVEFGNWVGQSLRQGILDAAYDACSDLVDLMGLPPPFISLGGKLAIAFGSRGKGFISGAAHFEPDKWVMHFTKKSGVGAFAHEFGHALDAYLFTRNWNREHFHHSLQGGWYLSSVAVQERLKFQRGEPLSISTMAADYKQIACGLRDAHLNSSLRDVWRAIHGDLSEQIVPRSQFCRNGAHLDRGSKRPYWTNPTELFARLFESWVADKIEDDQRLNEYLVTGAGRQTTAAYWGLEVNPYPEGEERTRLIDCMDYFVLQAGDYWRAQAQARAATHAATPVGETPSLFTQGRV